MRALVLTASLVLATDVALAGGVSFEKSEGGVVVKIDGREFAVYKTSKKLPKPFFSPVRAADGTIISRSLIDPEDHQHHKGTWVSVDEVNEVDFWAEKGKIVNKSAKTLSENGVGVLSVVNEWQTLEGELVVTEKTTITIHPNRLLTYDINFVAPQHDVTFGDTKEGLFGFRMVNSMREKEGGSVVNAEGKEGTKECWGKPSKWVDYFGPVEGKVYGVTLMDHPGNFRPSRYHVRNYGLFSVSPFGERAYAKLDPQSPTVKSGETLRLRYAIYFHDGDTKKGGVAAAYEQFVKASGK